MLEILTLESRTQPLSASSQVPDKIDSLYICPECANRAYCCIYVWIFTYYSVPWLIMVDERWLVITRFDRHTGVEGIFPLNVYISPILPLLVKHEVIQVGCRHKVGE